jgi:hypothetical protein
LAFTFAIEQGEDGDGRDARPLLAARCRLLFNDFGSAATNPLNKFNVIRPIDAPKPHRDLPGY